MKKTTNYLILLGFLGLFFGSCTKDKDGLVTPDIPEGIHFKLEDESFTPSMMTKEYSEGNMFFEGVDASTQKQITFIVEDKMKEGTYNFAYIFNVSMNFIDDQDEYLPVAGKFNLYELDKEKGTLKALFDCVLKNNRTKEVIHIIDGSINIQY